MTKRSFRFALALTAVLLGGAWTRLAHAQEPFFKGKTIHIVVGFSAGGGYDLYARAIARHMGRHIPGNPTIVVENMAGAASMISANHVYKVAKPDGLTIGHFIGGLFLQQVLGRQGIEFDARKFEYLGVPIKDTYCIGLTKASGITSLESWLAAKAPVKIGGTAPGSATDDIPAVLQAALGLPLQVVSGYKGTAEIRLAADSGEVAGFSTGWESFKSTWRKSLETGDAFIAVQAVAKPHPELPKVPLAINYAKTEEAKKLIQVGAHDPGILARPFVLPPGTPKDRVQVLRKAFMDIFNDPEFLVEAKKTNLDIGPLSGEEIAKTVENLFKLEAPVIERLKKILLPK
ncbi:MAG: tripartite tricarboxylate transporter substrate-binding protein [Deltaproteobacteria bacterium]|nr:tripartite tricarboxylate transporter substrate-binding protein [Deltaproteobacteria bacterium]MDZ4342913.1 tripartite tricarboxylate transporter substrate-binding protein [Candidatus Binatia bacterium]